MPEDCTPLTTHLLVPATIGKQVLCDLHHELERPCVCFGPHAPHVGPVQEENAHVGQPQNNPMQCVGNLTRSSSSMQGHCCVADINLLHRKMQVHWSPD